MFRAIIAAVCLAMTPLVEAGEAQVMGACLSLRVGPAVGNIPGTGLATNHLATPDGQLGFPQNVITNNGVRIFNRELRAESPEARAFAADYVTLDATGAVNQFGSVVLNTLAPPDSNGDGIPDLFTESVAGTMDFWGLLSVEWPLPVNADVTGRATRGAGSLSGDANFAVSVTGQPVVQYIGPFDIITLDGAIRYEHAAAQNEPTFRNPPADVAVVSGGAMTITTRLANTASLTVNIRRVEGIEAASGTMFFEIIDEDTLEFAAGELFSEGRNRFIESFKLVRCGNLYKGTFALKDGDPSTPWADFALYAVALKDTNDADGDGIPDISDRVAAPVTYDWILADRELSAGSAAAMSVESVSPALGGDFFARARTGSGVSTSAPAQIAINELLWAKKAGGAGYDFPRFAMLTPERHVLVAATIQPIAGNRTVTETGAIVDYDREGAARTIGSLFSPTFAIPERLCSHANGDVTAVGRYAGSLQCGATYIPSNGSTNGFVARFSQAGEARWTKTFPSAQALAVARDGDDNYFVSGVCEAGAAVGGIVLPESGIFVAGLSPAGDAIWASGTALLEPGVGDVAIDARGNVVVTGGCYAEDGGGYSRQIFVAKYSAAGEPIWSRKAGGNGTDYGARLAAGNDGEVFLAAAAESSWFRFDGIELPGFGPSNRIGLFKLNAEGRLAWARFAGADIYFESRVYGLRWFAGQGPLLIGAAPPGTMSFGDATLTAASWNPVFIAQVTEDGHTAALQSVPVPTLTTVAADCDELGELALTLRLEREVEIGGAIFSPQLTDALTLYYGKPLKVRAAQSGPSARIAWPRTWPDSWLESCEDLNRKDWIARTRGGAASHFDFTFEDERNSAARFYRLKRPGPQELNQQ